MSIQPVTVTQAANQYTSIETLLQPHLEHVEKRLLEAVKSDRPLVTQAAQYLVRAGGKRFRPTVVLLFSGITGGIQQKSIDLACSVELCHTATLIHDDIIDDANIRRGLESVNARWGNQVAVLSGDYLYATASSLVAYHGGPPFTKLLADSVAGMVQGEILELERGYEFYTKEQEYLEMIRRKTAELISMSCQFGVMVNSSNEKEIQAAAEYGLGIGLAFQIIDDALDYTSNLIDFGKPTNQDVKDGKITLPLIHLRDRLSESDRKRLEHIMLNTPSEADLKWVADSLQEQGSFVYVKKYARELVDRVKRELDIFPASEYKEALYSLGDYVIDRAC